MMLTWWLHSTIGWKFYLCFIIPGILSAILIGLVFPDTWGLPLEEVAALFGVSPCTVLIIHRAVHQMAPPCLRCTD